MFEIGDLIVYGTNGVCRVDGMMPGMTGNTMSSSRCMTRRTV